MAHYSPINFDSVYQYLLAPSISKADLIPLRGEEPVLHGIIAKTIFERILLSDVAIADITFANPNVFYGIGIRHALRSRGTILVNAKNGQQSRLDNATTRVLYYSLQDDGTPANLKKTVKDLSKLILDAIHSSKRSPDSPLFRFMKELQEPNLEYLKAIPLAQDIVFSETLKQEIQAAKGVKSLEKIIKKLNLGRAESELIIDLFLAYRRFKAWNEMIKLVRKMPRPLAETEIIQEQLPLSQTQ
jgi:uncharacterized protein DUF4071